MKYLKSIVTRVVLPCLMLIGFASTIQAQYYNVGVGFRAGGTSGLTIKGFVSPNTAVEAIIGAYPYGPSVTVLGEKYSFVNDQVGLYYGGGAHIRQARGWYESTRCNPFYGCSTYRVNERAFGFDAIFGVEWKIPVLPLAFSADIKPFLEFTDDRNTFLAYDIGLGAKFAF